MILYPAIDLKGGQCVRLVQGDMGQATVYNGDPGAQARAFCDQGFEWLHVVDLDGAFAGETRNRAAVAAILAMTDRPVQLGGGIRDRASIDAWLDQGIARIILGTAALHNPELVIEACQRHPGRIAVGIDARDGKVAVEGWAETSNLTTLDLARRFEDVGVAAIVFTDISRDGLLTGLNVTATAELASAIGIPVIASGGLASIGDIEAILDRPGQPIAGAISGKALYDGRLDSGEALALIAARQEGRPC